MRHISIGKAAVSVGTVLAAWHTMWVTLVGVGWAGSVLNFILELHFLKVRVEVAPYSAFTAFALVATTFCIGALLGAIFAIVWNWLTFADEPEWARDTKRAAPSTN
jgi:hypothetical protein